MKALAFYLLITLGVNIGAQPHFDKGYRLGLKLGFLNSNISGGRAKTHARGAFEGGLWLQPKLSRRWTAQAEILRLEKGAGDISHNSLPKAGEYAVSLFYYELPLLFQYHLKNFSFELGPGAGVNTYQHEVLVGAPSSNLTGPYPFTKSELSFNVGTGYSFNYKWYAGFRFTYSLLPVRKQIPDIPKNVYNRTFKISVARSLNFGKNRRRSEEVDQ